MSPERCPVQVNILEAKTRLSQLIRSVQAGEEVIIANRGQPVAKLVPAEASRDAEKGSARRILDHLKAHPLPDDARRSMAEIDSDIEADRESWD
jgi:prevent-host-death family protein